jgi:hypothetical protein
VESSHERNNEISCCIKYWAILEYLSDWWFLKKGSGLVVVR